MIDENRPIKTNESRNHGVIIMTISFVSVLIWILISSGYNPLFSFIVNLYYNLKINFFETCEVQIHLFGGESVICEPTYVFDTINFILISIVSATYGFLIWMGLVTSPVVQFRRWFPRKD